MALQPTENMGQPPQDEAYHTACAFKTAIFCGFLHGCSNGKMDVRYRQGDTVLQVKRVGGVYINCKIRAPSRQTTPIGVETSVWIETTNKDDVVVRDSTIHHNDFKSAFEFIAGAFEDTRPGSIPADPVYGYQMMHHDKHAQNHRTDGSYTRPRMYY